MLHIQQKWMQYTDQTLKRQPLAHYYGVFLASILEMIFVITIILKKLTVRYKNYTVKKTMKRYR